MKIKIIITVILLLATAGAYADNHISAGYEIGEIGDDLIIGGRITSPFFFGGYAAVRVAGDSAWNKTDESAYSFFRTGLIGSSGMINDFVRLYGEGGISILSNAEGSGKLVFGGYGLFGFEFFTGENSPLSYFIELGTLGSSISRLTGFNTKAGLSLYF